MSTSSSPPSTMTWAHPLGIFAVSRYFLGIFTVFLVWVVVFLVGVVVGDGVRSKRRILLLASCGNGCFPCNVLMHLTSMFRWNEVKLSVVLVVLIIGGEVGCEVLCWAGAH